jgi:hypothetical protein
MNLITFTYYKAGGKSSERALAPIIVPSKFYEGIDISELDDIQQAEYVMAVDVAKAAFVAECAKIQAQYDVKTMYRRFNPSRMTKVVIEDI